MVTFNSRQSECMSYEHSCAFLLLLAYQFDQPDWT